MKHTVALTLVLLAAAPASGQLTPDRWLQRGTLVLTAEAGGAAFTDFHRAQAQPIESSAGLADFRRRVSAHTSGTLGASASYWMARTWGVRVGGAWVPTSFSVWNEESAQRVLDQGGDGEPPRYTALDIMMADAAVVFRFPHSFGRVAPYGLVGGSYVRYRTRGEDELPPEARQQFSAGRWSGPAALFGIGAVLPLERKNILMAFELTNHLSRTPLHRHAGGEEFEVNGVQLRLEEDERTGSDDVGLTSNLRLTVGLALPVR